MLESTLNKLARLGVLVGALLLASSPPLGAHDAFEQVPPREFDLSLPVGVLRYQQVATSFRYSDESVFWYSPELGPPQSISFRYSDREFNGKGVGLSAVLEYGILPGISVGVMANIPQMLIDNFVGIATLSEIAVHANWTMVRTERFRLQLHGKVQASGLFVGSPLPRWNTYGILGSGFQLIDLAEGSLAIYLDLKAHSTSFITQAVPLSNILEYMLGPQGAQAGEFADVPVSFEPLWILNPAVGFDIKYGAWIFSIGWNIPPPTLLLDEQQMSASYYWPDLFDLANLESTLRFRFR